MPHRSPHGRGLALVAAGGLFAASMLAGGSATASSTDGTAAAPASTTTATGTAQDASTPVPVATPDGYLMSYVVNAKSANPGQTRRVERPWSPPAASSCSRGRRSASSSRTPTARRSAPTSSGSVATPSARWVRRAPRP